MAARNEEDGRLLTAEEKAALDRLMEAGLTDPRRIKQLVDLADAAQAWGFARRFLLQAAAATGALSMIAAAILWFRDWLSKG